MEASTAVLAKYGDLPFRGRPVHNGDLFSRRHPPMRNRAKIFAPFAALVGFEEEIRSKDVQYEAKRTPELHNLNKKLRELHGLTRNGKVARANQVKVTVEYYIPCTDPHNDAFGVRGMYRKITGTVREVDTTNQELVLFSGERISFRDMFQIEKVS